MNLNIYTIFDLKAKAYNAPFFMANDDVATRAFADAVQDPNSMFSKHPEDYTLHCLGYFNDNTGQIDTTIPVLVASASSVAEVQLEIKPDIKEVVNNG